MAVLGQTPFQVLEALQQVSIMRQQSGNALAPLGILGFKFGDALLFRHASMLHVLRTSA
jgi:hypothetical protein